MIAINHTQCLRNTILHFLSYPFSLVGALKLDILCIGSLNALLNNLPKLGSVDSARNPYALLSWGEELGQCTSCLLSCLGLIKGAFCDDGHLKSLIVLRRLAVLGIPLEEGDFVLSANQHSGNGYGVMQGRSGGDAKGVTVIVNFKSYEYH